MFGFEFLLGLLLLSLVAMLHANNGYKEDIEKKTLCIGVRFGHTKFG
jgi:hypothetical protein